jgi:DNA repair protein RecO (recombination protein O)
MSIHRTQAIVLRSRKFRESSKIVIFFTLKHGKISTVAKGCLRPKSKFGSSLELFTRSSIIFYRKENRDLHTLSHSEVVKPHKGLRKDVVKVAYASVIGEMIDKLLPGEEPNKALYGLLGATLEQIDAADRSRLEIILSSCELKMLHLIGYGPELAKCIRCGAEIGKRTWFGLLSGGVLCRACSGKDLNAVEVSQEALALLREYQSEPIEMLGKRYSSDEVSREASDILHAFLRAQTGESATIRSLDFLERIRDISYA